MKQFSRSSIILLAGVADVKPVVCYPEKEYRLRLDENSVTMVGRCPDRREGIIEGEYLESASAGQERMEAHNWEGQGPIWAVAPQDEEQEYRLDSEISEASKCRTCN
jgi:hypothetical protein